MRIPQDLHPADENLRQVLIDTLRLSREGRRLPRRPVADLLGTTIPAVHRLEHRTTWQARTVARYARTIGWRIQWQLCDLDIPDDDDVMATILAAGDTSTPERADRVHWRTVCYDLVRIRRATCTAGEMGRRCCCHENAIHHWEANPDGSSVIAAQRHARALGGMLSFLLHEAASPLVHHAPGQRNA